MEAIHTAILRDPSRYPGPQNSGPKPWGQSPWAQNFKFIIFHVTLLKIVYKCVDSKNKYIHDLYSYAIPKSRLPRQLKTQKPNLWASHEARGAAGGTAPPPKKK